MLFNTYISIIVIYQENFVLKCFVNIVHFLSRENWPMEENIWETPQSALNTEFSQ